MRVLLVFLALSADRAYADDASPRPAPELAAEATVGVGRDNNVFRGEGARAADHFLEARVGAEAEQDWGAPGAVFVRLDGRERRYFDEQRANERTGDLYADWRRWFDGPALEFGAGHALNRSAARLLDPQGRLEPRSRLAVLDQQTRVSGYGEGPANFALELGGARRWFGVRESAGQESLDFTAWGGDVALDWARSPDHLRLRLTGAYEDRKYRNRPHRDAFGVVDPALGRLRLGRAQWGGELRRPLFDRQGEAGLRLRAETSHDNGAGYRDLHGGTGAGWLGADWTPDLHLRVEFGGTRRRYEEQRVPATAARLRETVSWAGLEGRWTFAAPWRLIVELRVFRVRANEPLLSAQGVTLFAGVGGNWDGAR